MTASPHRWAPSIAALVTAACMALLFSDAFAARLHPEDHYNRTWCAEQLGVDECPDSACEVVQVDRTRVDCLLPDYAVEADFAAKWYEGLGQAVHYARLTGLRPGVLLIIERRADCRHVERARASVGRVSAWIDGLGLVPVRMWLTGRSRLCGG